jgi:methanogenic corrinoid protein MtbC1
MNAGDPALFANHVAWVTVMLASRGTPPEDLERHLVDTRAVVRDALDGEAGDMAVAYIDAGLTQLPLVPTVLPTHLADDAPLVDLARAYLDALLQGDRQLACRMILDAVASGIRVQDIYLHVFQSTQHEIGRLWQLNQISVGQEHYCTAATQLVMSQLYPHIFASPKHAGRLVSTCVSGDLHEMGIRVVTDLFEMDGWNTYYLGANMPADAVLDTVVRRHAQVLAVSATLAFHLRAVSELIDKVRSRPECDGVKILVGGHPFRIAPALWRKVGADGTASSAHEAIAMANLWIS